MSRLMLILVCLLWGAGAMAAGTPEGTGPEDAAPAVSPASIKDVYFGEALYRAYLGDWFDAVARLDTELAQHSGLDEPARDSLYPHVGQAEFDVGDFELGYRMNLRAGRAIKAVIDGKVDERQRNAAIYRLARLHFRKDEPQEALKALERIRGKVPEAIRDDVEFLRAELFLAVGRFDEAARVLDRLQGAKGLEGFAGYNLGIALMGGGKEQEGRKSLDRAGQLAAVDAAAPAIRDKAKLVLGYRLLEKNDGAAAKPVLDRVRLTGPFSNRALLGSGWADAGQGHFENALVPWSILAKREVTDPAVQEAKLALPYAYGKLKVYGKAARLYGDALEAFGSEIGKLDASIASVKEGSFLKLLAREELKQDADWVVKLRALPKAPETYYLLDLMASHDFQESLKKYLDLLALEKKLSAWEGDLDAFEEMIKLRRAYYEPLLPEIDRSFKELDSRIRLRREQTVRIEKRLHALLTAPRPDALATADERIAREELSRLERTLPDAAKERRPPAEPGAAPEVADRTARLRGVNAWDIATRYHERLTETFEDLDKLNEENKRMQRQYDSFVRARQAAVQSCEGYDGVISRGREEIAAARKKVADLLPRQAKVLEAMAVEELGKRRARLEQFQVTARFAIADSYDRANKAQAQKRTGE